MSDYHRDQRIVRIKEMSYQIEAEAEHLGYADRIEHGARNNPFDPGTDAARAWRRGYDNEDAVSKASTPVWINPKKTDEGGEE